MENDLKVVFAGNLIKLRTAKGLTQAELAEMIHYSDKSVSKWERGEAIPDAFVLKQLAEIFGVSVDALLTEERSWRKTGINLRQEVQYSQRFIIICVILGIFTLCLLEFIIAWTAAGIMHWLMLYIAIPCSLIVVLVFNTVWYKGRHNMVVVMGLVLSLIIFIYLLLLKMGIAKWQFLLLIVPVELVVWAAFNIRTRRKHKKQG